MDNNKWKIVARLFRLILSKARVLMTPAEIVDIQNDIRELEK